MTPYLTDVEVAEITDPLTQGAARIKFFREVVRCRCEPKPNGQPLVWRADFEAARAPVQEAANDSPAAGKTQNWAEFEKKVAYGNRGAKEKRRQSTRP